MPCVDSRIAVLASGSGTNLQALLDDKSVGPCVTLVVSDVPAGRCPHGLVGRQERQAAGGRLGVVDGGLVKKR